MVSTNTQSGPTRSVRVPDPPANVLLLAPTMEVNDDEAFSDLLSGEDPARQNLLLVTTVTSPDRRLDVLRRHAGDLPSNVAVVGVGDGMRSGAGSRREGDTPSGVGATGAGATTTVSGTDIRTASVAEPGDLTGLGIEIGRALSAWDGDDNEIRACVHSVTALLQYADLRRVFRFLHVLTRRLVAVESTSHFHLDPTRVDGRTLGTVRSLFDVVTTYEAGGWTG